jgi:hypothetical protein
MRIRSGRVRMGAGEPPSRLEAWDPAARARLVRVARDAASEMLRYAAQVGLTPPPDRGSRPVDPPSGKIRWTAGRFLKGHRLASGNTQISQSDALLYAWWPRPKPRSNSAAPRHQRPSIAKVFVIVGILDFELARLIHPTRGAERNGRAHRGRSRECAHRGSLLGRRRPMTKREFGDGHRGQD